MKQHVLNLLIASMITLSFELGNLAWVTRVGYEIDNIWVESSNEQAWYPIPGYERRAPLTWPSIPQMVER